MVPAVITGGGGFTLPDLARAVPMTLVVYVTWTAAGICLYIALLRRSERNGELASAAAASSDAPDAAPAPVGITQDAPGVETTGQPLPPNLGRPIDGNERVGPNAEEAGVPRWLRSSLRNARRGDDSGRMRGWD